MSTRLDMMMMERAELWAKLQQDGGRGVDLAERIDQLDRQIQEAGGQVGLVCPSCGSDNLAEVSMVMGVCRGEWYKLHADAEPEFEGGGYTEMIWDATEPAEEPADCRACGWSGKPELLITVEQWEASQDAELECEDCDVNGYDCRLHGAAIAAAVDAARTDPDRTLTALRAAGLVEPIKAEGGPA